MARLTETGIAAVIDRSGIRPPTSGNGRTHWAGLLALVSAVPVALGMHALSTAFSSRPELAVEVTGAFAALLLALAVGAFLFYTRRDIDLYRPVMGAIAAIAVALTAVYLFWVSYYVFFPADILIWSESDFVNDILKFRLGYPLYTAQVNNESFTYVPGAQLLTYALAAIAGKATSIPAYRIVQLLYTGTAAVIGTLCCRRLLVLAKDSELASSSLWAAVCTPVLFLAATNSLTNRFTHSLHNDALAQLITVLGFYLLLRYACDREPGVLAAMAILPAAGFLVKQTLALWVVFYIGYLLFAGRRSWPKVLGFAAVSFGLIGAVVCGCYLIWGQPFFYWTVTVLGSHAVSPLRSFQHLLDVWLYFAIGLLGGAALLRERSSRHLWAAWLVWLALITLQTYTSGIAWMLNHIGPGCLLAVIWFLAALPQLLRSSVSFARSAPHAWVHAAIGVAAVALLFSGLGFFRIPAPPISADARRYVHQIEAEMTPASSTLLDAGSWVYLANNVLMKDRAPSIGERGYSQTGDFSGILQRITEKRYSKILVRNFHGADFWYDYYLWPKPSGIRQTMLDHYQESGIIRAVAPPVSLRDRAEDPYLFSDITVLTPKTDPSENTK